MRAGTPVHRAILFDQHLILKHRTVTLSMHLDLQNFWNHKWRHADAAWISQDCDHHVQQWLQGRGTMSILEIGCGQGWNAAYLHAQGHRVVAVDISDVVIQQNQQRWPDMDFRVIDMLEPGVDLGQFDLVIERGVMVVLNQAQDRSRLMAAAARHLGAQGHVLSLCDCSERRQHHDLALSHRSIVEVVQAMEPHLIIQNIRAVNMPVPSGHIAAWFTVACPRHSSAV